MEKLWVAPSTDLGHMFRDAGVDVTVFPEDLGKELAKEARVEFGHRFELEICLHFGHQLILRVDTDDLVHAAAAALHYL